MNRLIKETLARVSLKIKKSRAFTGKEIAFLHIGKNAGTQIQRLSEQINRAQSKHKIIIFGHGCKLVDLPKNAPYFFSVRDPVRRFKSGFYSRKRKGQPRLYNEWEHEEEIAFSDFEHANDLAEALFKGGELGQKAFWAMNNIGHVRSQQVDWFERAGYFLIDRQPIFIIRQEHFDTDFNSFLERLGLGITLKDLQIAKGDKAAHSFNYAGVPELSELAKSNLQLWYKRDLEFYSTCVNWILEKNS